MVGGVKRIMWVIGYEGAVSVGIFVGVGIVWVIG